MSSYLVNFAKTGNPNGEGLEKWNPYNSSEISFMKIGDPFTTIKFSEEKYKFWEEYFNTLGL
jgi:carboxylesterase type B